MAQFSTPLDTIQEAHGVDAFSANFSSLVYSSQITGGATISLTIPNIFPAGVAINYTTAKFLAIIKSFCYSTGANTSAPVVWLSLGANVVTIPPVNNFALSTGQDSIMLEPGIIFGKKVYGGNVLNFTCPANTLGSVTVELYTVL